MATKFDREHCQRLKQLTPEPHHLPGYAGYCPQTKFNFGRTNSCMTAVLAQDCHVAKGCRSALANCPPTGPNCRFSPMSSQDIYNIRNVKAYANLGGMTYHPDQIPGYTGHQPLAQFNFGLPFTDSQRVGLEQFDRILCNRTQLMRDHLEKQKCLFCVERDLNTMPCCYDVRCLCPQFEAFSTTRDRLCGVGECGLLCCKQPIGFCNNPCSC